MQQVIVHQVPAPTLVVAAQQGHVTLALHGRAFGGDADDGHGAQRALPPHLPGVPALAEADLGARPVRALRDGVAVQGEAVLLDVDVPGAVVGAEGVVEGTDLALVGGHVAEDVGAQGLLGQAAGGQAAPHLAVLVAVQDAVPQLADQRAAPQLPQLRREPAPMRAAGKVSVLSVVLLVRQDRTFSGGMNGLWLLFRSGSTKITRKT